MAEAPKHVWLHPTETVNNKESWIDNIRVSHPDSYVDDSCEGVKYIRADLIQERIENEKILGPFWSFHAYGVRKESK